MSGQDITTVTAGVETAFITGSLDFDPGAGVWDLANYMRDATTSYCYTWNATGQLLTQVTATGNLPLGMAAREQADSRWSPFWEEGLK